MQNLKFGGILFFSLMAFICAVLLIIGFLDPETQEEIQTNGEMSFWLPQIAFFFVAIASFIIVVKLFKKLGQNL